MCLYNSPINIVNSPAELTLHRMLSREGFDALPTGFVQQVKTREGILREGILNSTENYGRSCLTPLSPHHYYILS